MCLFASNDPLWGAIFKEHPIVAGREDLCIAVYALADSTTAACTFATYQLHVGFQLMIGAAPKPPIGSAMGAKIGLSSGS